MSTSNTHQQSFADAGSETRPLMLERGTAQNKVDRETRFNNEFDQFVAKPGEALFLVYDHFSKILNDLERNHINFPHVTVNTKFLNCLQPEWPKYVTHVRLSKRLTVDSYDDLFDYLQQFEKLVNASRAKKLEKSHDPLALVAHTGSSSKTTSPYYVIHPSLVVDYDDDYQGEAVQNTFEDPLTSAMIILARAITQNFSNPTNNHLHTSSNTRNQAIVQGDRVNIQSRNSSNGGRNTRCSYVQEEIIECNNVQNDAGNIQRTLRLRLQKLLQMFNATTAVRKTVELQKTQLILKRKMIENEDAYYDTLLDLEAKVKKNVDTVLKIGYFLQGMFMLGPKPMSFYDSQLKHGLGYANPYTLKKAISQNPKLYDASCLDDSKIHMNVRDTKDIDSAFLNVNSGSVEYDNNVQESYELEQLAKNAYKEAEKQQIIAKKVQEQNIVLTKQLESYKEKFICDRDIIRDLEQQRDKLQLSLVEFKRQIMELQKTQTILERKISESEDKYHDIVLDLEAKAKKNEDVVLKISNSLQGMFMLGPKPMSFYDLNVKHGLGYINPYTLKKAISQNPKLYDASCFADSKIHANIRDTEDILNDATQS
ncbi:hypothetical protein Tco_0431212 [Tanacetum coccineum]